MHVSGEEFVLDQHESKQQFKSSRLEPDAAHGGSGWVQRKLERPAEFGKIWSKCGANSECGKLRSVLLHRPQNVTSSEGGSRPALFSAAVDLEAAQKQFDSLVQVYRQHGVEVLEIEDEGSVYPNLMFVRDLFAMTPQGAIVSRPAGEERAGEEVIVSRTLAANHIPIVMSVFGNGYFEASDLVFVKPTLALIGIGLRSNRAGVQQVRSCLELMGIEVVEIQTTYGCGHLDGVLNIVDTNKAVVYPTRLSFIAYQQLRKAGYSVIDLPDEYEASKKMAVNMVPLEPGLVLIASGCDITRARLRQANVESIPVEIGELMKAGGAMHCLTGIVCRDLL